MTRKPDFLGWPVTFFNSSLLESPLNSLPASHCGSSWGTTSFHSVFFQHFNSAKNLPPSFSPRPPSLMLLFSMFKCLNLSIISDGTYFSVPAPWWWISSKHASIDIYLSKNCNAWSWDWSWTLLPTPYLCSRSWMGKHFPWRAG